MMEIEEELLSLTSYDAGNNVLNGITLHPLQIVDVLKMLYSKRAIVRYDTGTGKTLLAAAAMKLLWREDPSRRFLIFIKKEQCEQTPKKLLDATGRAVIASCAAEDDVLRVFKTKAYLDYPMVLITHGCLHNQSIMRELFQNRKNFCGVIIDEAHVINNKGFAQSADVMAGVVSQFEYCWALTATPIITEIKQLAKLACIVDSKRYPNYAKLTRRISNGSFSIEDDPLFFINRTGEELGRNSVYNGHIFWVTAQPYQTELAGGNQLMQLCKGRGARNQAEALVRLILSRNGQRGLIYVRQHAIREWIMPFLKEAGIRFDCINGKVLTGRSEILREFNEEKSLDVILTSVTTALDADCDYVVFYEFTVELKQMIGRADRGLKGKTVDVFFMLTKGSFEPLYFKTTIVDRSELIKRILGISYRELESISEELEGAVL